MEISAFTFRLILLFIPGIITFTIIDSLTIHKERKLYQILLNSLIFGFICYVTYALLIYSITLLKSLFILLNVDREFTFLRALTDNSIKLDFKEIFITTCLSFPVAFLFTFFINYKILYRLAHKLKVSKKFGDIDLWSYIMNMEMPEWAVVRDVENNLMYEGWIQAFSDSSEDKNELFLRDVKVFRNSSGKELYEVPALYLARERKCLIVEFPLLKFSEFKDRPKNEKGGKNEQR